MDLTVTGRPTVLEIDLTAIADNVRLIRSRLAPRTRFMAVVKADGYGHGALAVARTALRCGADAIGVAIAEEGVALREAGIRGPILVLGATMAEQAAMVVDHDLEATLFDLETAQQLARRANERGHSVPVHLKVDTGMGRLGMAPEGPVLELARRLAGMPGVELRGLMSHLANADHRDPELTALQYRRFLQLAERLRAGGVHIPILHLANSAGALRFPGIQMGMVRVGIGLYGLAPYADSPKLRPALTLKSRVVMVKRVPGGFPVGYGHTFTTTEPMVLATVPVGYADGYRRRLSNRGLALLHGRRVAVVGRVSMDQIVLGLPPDLDAAVGDEVVLLGEQGEDAITAQDWADWLDTIHYEVVTGFGRRVPRQYRIGNRVVAAGDVDDQFVMAL
jgi:alanine racemase